MASHPSPERLVHFTNCRLVVGKELVPQDLWVSSSSGRIVDGQVAFFTSSSSSPPPHETTPIIETVDLGGAIVSAGFIELQLNGAYGFDFSAPSPRYADDFGRVNRRLVETGVTSYLPTLTSQRPDVYRQVLPLLAAPIGAREPALGAEPLGTHCEGPFLSKKKPGIHAPAVLQQEVSVPNFEACYGRENLRPSVIRKVTLAPELDTSGREEVVKMLAERGIVASIGHTAATNEEATRAVEAGVSMVTHMFNAMPQPHHRDIGVFGLLGGGNGQKEAKSVNSVATAAAAARRQRRRPFFGLITDGVHVSPQMAAIAYDAHPAGCCVVTDSLHVLGLEDGVYAWPNGGQIRKRGARCTSLDGSTLAGASATLDQCVANLIRWTGVGVAEGLATVTEHPARLLGLENTKGTLAVGADADLVVLRENGEGDSWTLAVEQVWKFGQLVYSKPGAGGIVDDRARL